MNNQEIFDKVSAHLIKQGRISIGLLGSCRYRTSDGLMCAVGCLIDDENYNERIENKSINSKYVIEALVNQGIRFDSDTIPLLRRLQMLHDNIPTSNTNRYSIFDLKERLKGVASEFKLKINYEQTRNL